MTDAEREMMNTIHLYGLILSLDDRCELGQFRA